MNDNCCAAVKLSWKRQVIRPLAALLVVTLCGCEPSDSENDGGRSNRLPYQRIKRSDPRQSAVNVQNSNYLKQIGIAIHTFHEIYGQFPVGDGGPIKYQDDKPLLSWRVHLLPFLEAEPLYNAFRTDEPWDSPHNIQLLERMPEQYKNMNYQGLGNKTTVLGLSGPGAVFDSNRKMQFRDITDGLTQTIIVVVAGPEKAVPWTKPDDLTFDPATPRQSLGTVGDSFLALFGDGSVQPIGKVVGPKTMLNLFQCSDGAAIDFDDLHQ